jgi:hypothetical protein
MAIISRKFLAKSGYKARYEAQILNHTSIYFLLHTENQIKKPSVFSPFSSLLAIETF